MAVERDILSNAAGADVGRYPRSAYDFVLEGLNFGVERFHGPLTPAQAIVAKYMAAERIDVEELIERLSEGLLDPVVCEAIEEAGGVEALNRHIRGQELCWALRDWALMRWGALASVVLGTWGIRETLDFGHLVFELITCGRLQRQAHDRIDDFREVYDFKEALDCAYCFEFQS